MTKSKQHSSLLARRQLKQSPWQRFFSSQRFLALIFLAVFIAISLPFVETLTQKKVINQEIAALQKQNELYRSRSQEMKELAEYLQSEASLEEQARINLGLKKTNETVVVVNLPDTPQPITETAVTDSRTANWNRWLAYFFK
ncbi:septum formation initiator family protein [Candidatus Falkowbacteria bacterium]|jgi:cell division protein FtsB|nr:septum formation initiator family protein [Patescibacteria group bacterium]MDD3435320.1 septum formation initiator family protein [Patescibacteria group bacterium]MDD4466538.1 septum formation initiator family protein [Patescibacteria group bacterium]NCU43036.1 septum formation initiator family protein [Candidatus Falkowbacteria bacterium]